MKIRLLVILLTLATGVFVHFTSLGPSAKAQHTHTGACNKLLYEEALNTISELVRVSQQAVADEDFDQALEMMGHIRRQSAAAMAFCAGLVFQSNALGLQATISSVSFPEGAYIARVITNGAVKVTVRPESGNCGSTDLLFVVDSRQAMAPNGAETAFSSQTCLATIEVSDATEPWLLQFEPSGTSGTISMHHAH
jgi:hypothetical protein